MSKHRSLSDAILAEPEWHQPKFACDESDVSLDDQVRFLVYLTIKIQSQIFFIREIPTYDTYESLSVDNIFNLSHISSRTAVSRCVLQAFRLRLMTPDPCAAGRFTVYPIIAFRCAYFAQCNDCET